MATDRVLIKGILDLLAILGDHGRKLDPLTDELIVRLDRHDLDVQQVQGAMQQCAALGLVQAVSDPLDGERWFITRAGAARQARM